MLQAAEFYSINFEIEAAMKAEKIDLQGSGSDLPAGDTPQSGYTSASAGIDIAISIISISSISISTSGSDFSGSDGDPFRTGPLDYSL